MENGSKNSIEIEGTIREGSVKRNKIDGTLVFDLFHEEFKTIKKPNEAESITKREYMIISVFCNTNLSSKIDAFISGGTSVSVEGRLKYQRSFRIDARNIFPLK